VWSVDLPCRLWRRADQVHQDEGGQSAARGESQVLAQGSGQEVTGSHRAAIFPLSIESKAKDKRSQPCSSYGEQFRSLRKYFSSFLNRRFLSRFFHKQVRILSSSVRKQYLPVSPAGFFFACHKIIRRFVVQPSWLTRLAYTRARAHWPFLPDAAFLRFLSCV